MNNIYNFILYLLSIGAKITSDIYFALVQCEKRLLGHKGAINSLAIHPTGRLALSVGVDRTLHTWDLVKGRKAYVCSLQEGAFYTNTFAQPVNFRLFVI